MSGGSKSKGGRMKKGKVKWKNDDRGFGRIIGDDKKEYFFHLSALHGVKFETLKEDDRLKFDVEITEKGPRAVNIHRDQIQRNDPRARTNTDEYRFLNPFNFARFLPAPIPEDQCNSLEKKVARALLSRCPPPPHDRYVGLSGSITCRLSALSPLFISDAQNVVATNDHKSYRFFRLGEQFAIPGSSLRGMVRSVFEAVTGSCMMHIDDSVLSHRVATTKNGKRSSRRDNYTKSPADLLREEQGGRFDSCRHPNKLCPACRTFGWVSPDDQDLEPAAQIAYRGRVRFSHAKHDRVVGDPFSAILAILSSPRPTAIGFYLRHKNGSSPEEWSKDQLHAGYDGKVALRGYKIYRRPKKSDLEAGNNGKKEYERVDGTADIHNRTVRDALPAGNEFVFTVDFDNLSQLELGALLWSLSLEDDWAHRLGYAKPLGFGEVKNAIEQVELRKAATRYDSLENDGISLCDSTAITAIKAGFRESMELVFGKRFNALETLLDLKALLGPQAKTLPPVHYPRLTPEPTAAGENFKWFKDQGLPFAENDHDGFCL